VKENLEKHASQTTRLIVGESFKDNFNGNLAPSFDRSCRELFVQLAENLEKSFKKQQSMIMPQQQYIKETLPEGIAVAHQLLEIAEKLTGTIINTQSNIRQFTEQRDEDIDERVIIKRPTHKEVAKPTDVKTRTQQMITSKNYDGAFSVVLAERDLALISWLVSIIEPGGKMNLSQTVIISVIQQLTCSASLDIIKIDWLQYCVTELEPKDPIIGPYVDDVLLNLSTKIKLLLEMPDPSQKEVNRQLHILLKQLSQKMNH